jgi:signal transduction histidine kinase
VIIWSVGLVLAVLLSAVIPTVWFYGLSLGFLVWVTVAFAGRFIAIAIIVVMASMSLYSVNYFTGVADATSIKLEQNEEISGVAQSLIDNDVTVIFGDYWEVLPVAYASGGDVSAITSTFNRFPPPDSVLESPEVLVGVTSGRIALPNGLDRWTTSDAVEELVTESCRFVSPLPGDYMDAVSIYRCPSSVLTNGLG